MDSVALQVRVVLYSKGVELMAIKFDSTGSTLLNWFSVDRVLKSPWSDLKTENKLHFTINGSCGRPHDRCRAFFINGSYGGCSRDAGWLVLSSHMLGCSWEQRGQKTLVLYSKKSTYATWSQFGRCSVCPQNFCVSKYWVWLFKTRLKLILD